MLAIASRRFKPHEDVQKLLQVLAHDPEVQAGFGVEWPIRKITEALNSVDPDPPWNDDRVENAKSACGTGSVALSAITASIRRTYGLVRAVWTREPGSRRQQIVCGKRDQDKDLVGEAACTMTENISERTLLAILALEPEDGVSPEKDVHAFAAGSLLTLATQLEMYLRAMHNGDAGTQNHTGARDQSLLLWLRTSRMTPVIAAKDGVPRFLTR